MQAVHYFSQGRLAKTSSYDSRCARDWAMWSRG